MILPRLLNAATRYFISPGLSFLICRMGMVPEWDLRGGFGGTSSVTGTWWMPHKWQLESQSPPASRLEFVQLACRKCLALHPHPPRRTPATHPGCTMSSFKTLDP